VLAARNKSLPGGNFSQSIADRMDGRMKALKSIHPEAVIEAAIPDLSAEQTEKLLETLGSRIALPGRTKSSKSPEPAKPARRGLVGLMALMDAGKEQCAG
jgi:hypothetical protein